MSEGRLKTIKRTAAAGKLLKNTGLKVLLYDIETSPNLAWVWGKYEVDALGDFVKERQIISFAWKWLGEKDVKVLALPSFPGYKRSPEDNKALIVELHKLISRADVAIGHNVDCFDDKMSNADFIRHGMKPTSPHRTIDTLKVARRCFRFNSNKLNDLGKRLGVGQKAHTGGFDLWARCMRGDMKAWARMMAYNKKDVFLLEKVYLRLRPWIKNHPDMNAADRHVGCPKCRGVKFERRGWNINKHGKSPRYQCQGCGGWSKGALVGREFLYR